MALKFFDDLNPQSSQLPFLDEFIKKEKNLKTDTFPIQEITRVKSDKGFMVKTEKFMVFIWKNQKITQQLIEALDLWINGTVGYELVVFLPNTKKTDFKLGVDFEKEVTWFTSKNGYTTIQEDVSYQDIDPDKNPFLKQ